MNRVAMPIVALAAMGCTPKAQDVPQPIQPVPSYCGREHLGYLIGLPRTDPHVADIASRSGAKTIRWISPGMAVTMDYRQDRLNVYLDEKGMIVRFSCG